MQLDILMQAFPINLAYCWAIIKNSYYQDFCFAGRDRNLLGCSPLKVSSARKSHNTYLSLPIVPNRDPAYGFTTRGSSAVKMPNRSISLNSLFGIQADFDPPVVSIFKRLVEINTTRESDALLPGGTYYLDIHHR